jgi:hypothetical protein
MYNEQTNAHLNDYLLYSSLFIAPTCFDANASSSGRSHSVPAKNVFMQPCWCLKKAFTFVFRIVETLKLS